MQTDQISRSSSGTESSSSGTTPSLDLDSSRNGALQALPSSQGSNSIPKTRTIAIAVEAHEKMQDGPYFYAFLNLLEQRNCKVVVICCLTRLYSEMGVVYRIDMDSFSGPCKKALQKAIDNQLRNLNHYLQDFRAELERRRVEFDIRIAAGPKSAEVLVQAATALNPDWVVLDRSFSGSQKTWEAALDCSLVLMKKPPELPKVIRVSRHVLGPVGQIELTDNHLTVEEPAQTDDDTSVSSSLRTPSSSSNPPAAPILDSGKVEKTGQVCSLRG